jgi:hypothetical protein
MGERVLIEVDGRIDSNIINNIFPAGNLLFCVTVNGEVEDGVQPAEPLSPIGETSLYKSYSII